MTLLLLLEMIASAFGDRTAVGGSEGALTYEQCHRRAAAGAAVLRSRGAAHLAFIGTSSDAFPIALFAASWAGIPLLPLNYRLGTDGLVSLLARHDDVLVIADDEVIDALAAMDVSTISADDWMVACAAGDSVDVSEAEPSTTDGDDVAVLLYTSGTTSEPKAVMLRHRHLTSYVVAAVEFASADDESAALVSVPPYHIAGVATILSNVYAGRRLVYLPAFDPGRWLDAVRSEGITNAMVVPTMLARLVDHLGEAPAATPTLRSLAYGGARMPVTVLERALRSFGPETDFVNAYGLTETSSTIAVLGPDDHRDALTSDDPVIRGRLGSAGRLVPGLEVAVRDDDGKELTAGSVGELWVRGEQVSGEYLGLGSSVDADGWFPTRDRGYVDADGYLFIEGRSDDTIIRGGENIAPAEIEDVLLDHADVADAAVVGVPDEEWGQVIAASVVRVEGSSVTEDELREWCRARLRSSKTPTILMFRSSLPVTETGKLLRRSVLADLLADLPAPG